LQRTAIKHQKATGVIIILSLVICLLILAFLFQGSRGIWQPDEGVHVSIAQAMLETGDWAMTRLHHELWLDKPPLSLWGVAAGIKLFGQNEWGARFFHGLCFVLTTILVFLLGKSLADKRQGLIAAAMYCTMVIPFFAGNVITPDTPLVLWATTSFFCFWKSVQPGTRQVVLWKMLLCAALGLGFLTKGPAALILSGAMFVFLVIQRRVLRYFLSPWSLAGLVIFSVFGLGWYIYVANQLPGAMAYFWDNQVLGRLFSDKYERNPGLRGMLIYLPVVLMGTLPWSVIWYNKLGHRCRSMISKSFWVRLCNNPADLLLCAWIVIPLLIYCSASSKLPLYALPIFPALAILCARLWPSDAAIKIWRANPFGFSRIMLIAIGLWAVTLLGLKFVSGHIPVRQDMRTLYALIKDKLPNEEYEIVSIKEHLEGLGFYDNSLIERVTTRVIPYTLFMPPENLNEEIEEIRTSKFAHVLLCRKEGRAKFVNQALADAKIPFEQTALPFRRYLFVCHPAREDPYNVRLVAMGDTGEDKNNKFSVANALYLLYAEKTFDSGVLLLGDNLNCKSEDAGNVEAAAQRSFEQPFADLLTEKVPFYAILGNHDNYDGIKEFELRYPLFNMKGRQYYSQSFGNGLVETFMLNSNKLPNDDPQQIIWLEQSLGESQAVWKIVVMHHPVYTTAIDHPSNPNMIKKLEPIFRQYGVSIVLQGHNHIYERLMPINGITYITAGSGGKIDRGNLKPDAMQRIAGNDDTEAFLMLEFDENICHLTAYNIIGTVIDETAIAAEPVY